jgi:probable rRNA maturation factor
MSEPSILFFLNNRVSIKGKNKIRSILFQLFKQHKIMLSSLNYVFCSDAELLKINQEFLGHDDYTDIITFDLTEKGQPLTGEIHISVDRVRENAKNQKTDLQSELLRVIFHGALHLCGFKDKNPDSKAQMRKKEDRLIQKFHVERKNF